MKVLFLVTAIFAFVFFEKGCNEAPTTVVNINKEQNTDRMNASSSLNSRQWIPATYSGLKLGKSTIKDVKRIFGKPAFEGSPEEKAFDNDPEDEVLLQYNNVAGTTDNIDITIGKKTKIVKAVVVYPSKRQTKQEFISKYGSNFFEIESWESMCIEDDHKEGESNKKMSYPIALVYPDKGMYISIQNDNRVNHIGYSVKCFDK